MDDFKIGEYQHVDEELIENIRTSFDRSQIDSRIVFMCCLCGREIKEEEESFGLALTDRIEGGFLEQWWIHGTCLAEKMVQRAREASPYLPQA